MTVACSHEVVPGTVSVWLNLEPLPSSCHPHTTVTSACDIAAAAWVREEELWIMVHRPLPPSSPHPLLSVSLHPAGIRICALNCGEARSDIPAQTTDMAVHPPPPSTALTGPHRVTGAGTRMYVHTHTDCQDLVYLREAKGSLPHRLSCNRPMETCLRAHVCICVCFCMLTWDFTCTVGTSHYFTANFFGLWTLLLNFMVMTWVSGEGKMEVTFKVKETCEGPTKIAKQTRRTCVYVGEAWAWCKSLGRGAQSQTTSETNICLTSFAHMSDWLCTLWFYLLSDGFPRGI